MVDGSSCDVDKYSMDSGMKFQINLDTPAGSSYAKKEETLSIAEEF